MFLSYNVVLSKLKKTCTTEILENDDNYIFNKYFRGPSLHLTVLFVWLKASPNGVTWLSLFMGLLGCCFLAFGGDAGELPGALLLFCWFVLDCVDGNLARYYGSSSNYGEYIDGVVCYTVFMLFPIAIGVHLLQELSHYGSLVWVQAGCALVSSLAAVFPRLLHQKKNSYVTDRAHYSENLSLAEFKWSGAFVKLFNNILNPSGFILPLLVVSSFFDLLGAFNLVYGILNLFMIGYCFLRYTILSKGDFDRDTDIAKTDC